MKAHNAGDVLAQIIAALLAGLAGAAGQRAIHHHRVAGLEIRHAVADRGDFARGFGADHERHLALGESHAAEAPDIDVVERDRLDRDLHLAGRGRRRGRDLCQFKLAVAKKRERADRCTHAGSRPMMSDTFCPPKPNELEMT